MNIPAQIFGGLAATIDIVGIQFKNKKNILISYTISSALFVISFLLLKAYSGAATAGVLGIFCIVNYLYDEKNKKIPKWMLYSMLISSTFITALFYQGYADIFTILSCIPYTLSLASKKEKNVRLFTFLFLLCYSLYDILVFAYAAFIGDSLFLVSTLTSIIRYDLIKRVK